MSAPPDDADDPPEKEQQQQGPPEAPDDPPAEEEQQQQPGVVEVVIGKIICFFGLRLCLPAWNNIVCITELACQTYSHDSDDLQQVVL